MNFGNWEVHLENRGWARETLIYLLRFNGKEEELLTHDGKTVTIQEGLMPVGWDDMYFARMTDDQLQALATALCDRGIKTQNDHELEGILEAQGKHLEDMRSLVFKDKKE